MAGRAASLLVTNIAVTGTFVGGSLASLRGAGALALALAIRPRGDDLEPCSVFYGVLDRLPDGRHQIANTAGVAIFGQLGELGGVDLPVWLIGTTDRQRRR